MRTPATIALLLAALAPLAITTPGCDITTYECQHGDCSAVDEGADGVCGGFCARLADCGTLAPEDEDACLSTCEDHLAADPSATESGCACVERDACQDPVDYDCPGAPFPGGSGAGAGGGGPGTGSGAGSGGSGGSGPSGCTGEQDCPAGTDCIGGECLSECTASCDCAEGESCEDGYCQAGLDPQISCEADCDCPGGSTCVDGACTPGSN